MERLNFIIVREVREDGFEEKVIADKPSCRNRYLPVLGAYEAEIDQWLDEDKSRPKKQRHTARRIYHRLARVYSAQTGHLIRIVLRLWCNSLAISCIDLRFRKYSPRMISFWPTVIISSTPLAQDVAHISCNQTGGYGGPIFYGQNSFNWSSFL